MYSIYNSYLYILLRGFIILYNMEAEVFKQIEDYPYYEISNYGNVKSLQKGNYGKISKLGKSGNGYLYKALYHNGSFKSRFIQVLVAEAFIPNPENKGFVNHKDGNKLNNYVLNLEWCTRSENLIHARDTGLLNPPKGSANGLSKLKEEDIPIIRQMFNDGMKYKQISVVFKVHEETIAYIIRGKTWTHIL